jgi:hypothetical protein
MEGFLQALKCKDPVEQAWICSLFGLHAKREGAKYNEVWRVTQTLWWKGTSMERGGKAYARLISRAFDKLVKVPEFRTALLATGCAELTHYIGENDPKKTVLTKVEFIAELYRLRKKPERRSA